MARGRYRRVPDLPSPSLRLFSFHLQNLDHPHLEISHLVSRNPWSVLGVVVGNALQGGQFGFRCVHLLRPAVDNDCSEGKSPGTGVGTLDIKIRIPLEEAADARVVT